MYIYFDSNGTLKEIITERPFRVGDVKRNKIYVYWDGEHAPASGWVKYRKPDGTDTTETSFFAYGQNLVEKELPQTPVRNLKYFSYDHTYVKNGVTKVGYQFYEITVPNDVLNSSSDNTDLIPTENNMVVARIRFVMVDSGTIGEIDDSDTIETLGAVVFSVETNMGIITDSSIDETQYNYLLWAIGNKVDTSAFITALNNKADRNNPSQTIVADRIVTDNITDNEDSTYGLDIIENTTSGSEQFKFEYMGELKIELDAGLQEMRLNNGFENTGIEIGENIKLDAPHIYNGSNQELATQNYVNSNVGTATQNALDLKVDKSSIVDNTTTNDATKVLSAKQGKVLRDDLDTEITNRQNADNNLQSQIDGINAGQNLADIVADLTALGNLDTTKLQSGDKVEVLSDSNHDNVSTVYNWNGTAFVYIGAYGMDSYTKAQMDTYLANKQDKIDSSHKLSSDLVDDTGHTNKFVTQAQKVKIDNAYGPSYVGEDTSTNILAKGSNTGIWKATDNGHWYYWNGTQYADGGVYQSIEIADNSIDLIKFNEYLQENFSLINLLNPNYNVSGGYYGDDGSIVSNVGSTYNSELIKLNNLSIRWSESKSIQFLTYDNTKTFIERISISSNENIKNYTFNSSVKYIKISVYQSNFNDFFIAYADKYNTAYMNYKIYLNGSNILPNSIDADALKDDAIIKSIANEVTYSDLTLDNYDYTFLGNGYINGLGDFVSYSTYRTSYFIVKEDSINLWYKSFTGGNYFSIVIYSNSDMDRASFIARYKNGDNNLPDENNKLTLTKGQVVALTYADVLTNFDLGVDNLIGYYELKNDIKVDQKNIKISKNGDNYLISMNDYLFNFQKFNVSAINLNSYDIVAVSKNGAQIEDGQLFCALKENGEVDFMGGRDHGDDIMISMDIYADGKPITESVSCNRVDIYLNTYLQRVSTKENVFKKFLHITFENNKMSVNLGLLCLVNNFVCDIAYVGMWGQEKPFVDKILLNCNQFDITTAPTDTINNNINEITYQLSNPNALITVKCNEHKYAKITHYNSVSDQRFKMYYAVAKDETFNENDFIKAYSEYYFN